MWGKFSGSAAALGFDAVILTRGCSDPCTAGGDPGEYGEPFSNPMDLF